MKRKQTVMQAKAQIIATRKQLNSTTNALKYRLAPANIANRAAQGMVHRIDTVANGTASAARTRPGLVALLVASIGLIAFRKHLPWTRDNSRETDAAPPRLEPKSAESSAPEGTT